MLQAKEKNFLSTRPTSQTSEAALSGALQCSSTGLLMSNSAQGIPGCSALLENCRERGEGDEGKLLQALPPPLLPPSKANTTTSTHKTMKSGAAQKPGDVGRSQQQNGMRGNSLGALRQVCEELRNQIRKQSTRSSGR